MKNTDNIKLDILSNIDEGIIDEATCERIVLLNKLRAGILRARKRFIMIGSAAASFVLIFTVLLSVILPIIIPVTDEMPVYRGMTVRRTVSPTVQAEGHIGTYLSGAQSGESQIPETPMTSIKDLVDTTVSVDEEVKYYVQPNETFIIEVHISNPEDYEIQSFTLNGKKYVNYMFKEGSTMELLLIEVVAPEESGYVEYTIDAIKYIDGTEIKDVDMSSGDKSIKVGIEYPKAPWVDVTVKNISPSEIVLFVVVEDRYSIICDGTVIIYLSDGQSIVAMEYLSVGYNTVTFDGLIMSHSYEYGVLAAYDLADGKDVCKEWLATETVTTDQSHGISNIEVTQSSVSFKLIEEESFGTVSAISIYDSATGELVQRGDRDTRSFENLLSGHTYDICIEVTYTQEGAQMTDRITERGITTLAKQVPTLEFGKVDVTDTAAVGSFELKDPDSVGETVSVDIYRDGVWVANNAEKKIDFSSLEYYSDYSIVVSYSYDLNDGRGVHTAEATHDIKTSPNIGIKSCKIINTVPVSEGEKIYMQIAFDNPSGALPSSVTVNGTSYPCTSLTTASMAFVEILCSGQFAGGDTVLTVESVTAMLDDTYYKTTVTKNNQASIFINSALKLESVELVVKEGGEYIARDYAFPSDDAYVLITLSNKTGYTVDSMEISCGFNSMNCYSVQGFTKIDDEHYIAKISYTKVLTEFYYQRYAYASVSNISYHNEQISKTVEGSRGDSVYLLRYDGIKEITCADDLLNMNEERYYLLKNDIDLSGINWEGQEFCGIFDGNGYAIKNMTYIGTAKYVGLFSKGYGTVKELSMESVLILADNACAGAFAGEVVDAYSLTFINCSVDKNSVISASNGYAGGFVGYGQGDKYINCMNLATVSGKIAGGFSGYCYGKFTDCLDDVNVENKYTGRDNSVEVENCYSVGYNVTAAQLSSKDFYINSLGWDETVWDFDDLDVANGKYPKLRKG